MKRLRLLFGDATLNRSCRRKEADSRRTGNASTSSRRWLRIFRPPDFQTSCLVICISGCPPARLACRGTLRRHHRRAAIAGVRRNVSRLSRAADSAREPIDERNPSRHADLFRSLVCRRQFHQPNVADGFARSVLDRNRPDVAAPLAAAGNDNLRVLVDGSEVGKVGLPIRRAISLTSARVTAARSFPPRFSRPEPELR